MATRESHYVGRGGYFQTRVCLSFSPGARREDQSDSGASTMIVMDNRAEGREKRKRILLFRTLDGASETLAVMRGHTKLKLLNYGMQSYANMEMQRVT